MTAANELTASQAAVEISAGRLSARDLAEACLARVAERDADVEAWNFLDPAMVRSGADALDAKTGDKGPLHGLLVGLKDIIDTADMPTENGSALYVGRRPVADSTIAKRLRDAGALIMGKTVSTEFAMSGAGKTRNPHDPARTPGGSSSGSAAAVADFQVPLAVGTQTGGSMIRPASFCGIHGYKPTFGSFSRAGVFMLCRPLDTLGVYGRSLDDLAMISDVLMAKDPLDLDMRPHLKPCLVDALKADLPETPPRIAFVKGPMWQAAEPYMEGLFEDVLGKLGEHAREVEMAGVFDRALECHQTVMIANAVANCGDIVENHADKLKAETIRRVKTGYGIAAEDYVKAIEFADTLRAAVDRMFENADVLITPAAPGEAPLGLESTGNPIFQKLWTLTGAPTVTLPKLKGPNGLPIGLQVIGRSGHDADLFRNALWIEQTL